MYIKNPGQIESNSMEIIDGGIGEHRFTEQELPIVKRMIHTTGDFDYKNIAVIKDGAIEAGIKALKSGCRIVTDTNMALSGINKRRLATINCQAENFINHEEVFKAAKEKKITRSMAAMDFAAQQGVDIFVIGNAPTALFRIGELMKAGKVNPKLIIGIPVGFVGAAESKEYLRTLDIPSVSTVGTKGGSNVAAAVMNALIYMTVGNDILNH